MGEKNADPLTVASNADATDAKHERNYQLLRTMSY